MTSLPGILCAALLILGLVAGTRHFRSQEATQGAESATTAEPLAAYDPDSDGWQRLHPHDNRTILRETTDFATIIQKQWRFFYLAVP